MAVSMIGPKFYAWDRNGKPLAFGKIYTYQARTNTPKATYQSEDQAVENTNPVILNGEGYANVYLDGSYKVVLKDSNDNEIWSADPVTAQQASEWSHCFDAQYLSSSSFKIAGNQTSVYSKSRKIRIDNNLSDYSYSFILSSTFASGDTTVVVADPVVTTGIIGVCVSIVTDKSTFNKEDVGGYSDYSFSSVNNMRNGIVVNGDSVKFRDGQYLNSGRTRWKVTTSSTAVDLVGGLFAEPVGAVFSDDFEFSQLDLAIDSTPNGGVLRLGLKSLNGKLTKRRDNISIIGYAMPRFAGDGSSLVNGSIIRGTFVIDGDNVTCENFGVDSGVTACNELNGGAAMEGFIAHDSAQAVLRKNNNFRNIIGLARNPADPVHAVLIEGQEDGSADNIHGRRGNFGVVFKVSRFNIGKASGYEVGSTGVYLKSDSYAPVLRVNADQFNYFDLGANADQPVAVHASTSACQDVNVGQVNIDGGKRQFRLISNTSGANIMDNVNVAVLNARNATEIGFDTFGIIFNSNLKVANIINSASGKYLLTQVQSLNINLGQVNCVDNLGNNDDEAVKLSGWVVFDNIVACRGYDYDHPMGIFLNTATPGGLKCKIGSYVGRLNLTLSASDLENGWQTRFGQEAGCIIRNNKVKFFGRINPANVGVGNERFFTLDSFLVPFVQRNFLCKTYAANNAVNDGTVLVTVSSGGAVEFPNLNNTVRWPGTGSIPDVTWIDLDGIEFDISDVVY